MKSSIINSIQESYNELRYKTSWPTRSQVVKSALIVMVTSAILAVVILFMDKLIQLVMEQGIYRYAN